MVFLTFSKYSAMFLGPYILLPKAGPWNTLIAWQKNPAKFSAYNYVKK